MFHYIDSGSKDQSAIITVHIFAEGYSNLHIIVVI